MESQLRVCFLISVLFTPSLSSSTCGHFTFEKVSSKSGYTTTDNVIQRVPATDAPLCVSRCFMKMACMAAILDMDTQYCKLLSDVMVLDSATAHASSVYFEKTMIHVPIEATVPAINCSADCSKANTEVGPGGDCRCISGYTFNPVDASCVEVCSGYDNTFVPHNDAFCSSQFPSSLHGGISRKDCEQKCLSETPETCKGFEMCGVNCMTHSVIGQDMASVPEESGDCIYYQRSCTP